MKAWLRLVYVASTLVTGTAQAVTFEDIIYGRTPLINENVYAVTGYTHENVTCEDRKCKAADPHVLFVSKKIDFLSASYNEEGKIDGIEIKLKAKEFNYIKTEVDKLNLSCSSSADVVRCIDQKNDYAVFYTTNSNNAPTSMIGIITKNGAAKLASKKIQKDSDVKVKAAEARAREAEARAREAEAKAREAEARTRAATEHQQPLDVEVAKLMSYHPDLKEVATSSEFKTWLSYQDSSIKTLAASSKATDVIYVIDKFKTDSKQERLQQAEKAKSDEAWSTIFQVLLGATNTYYQQRNQEYERINSENSAYQRGLRDAEMYRTPRSTSCNVIGSYIRCNEY